MPRRAKNLWPARRRSAVETAEALVSANGNSFPVNLGRIAESRSIHRIEFKPLLTEGGLAVQNDGFIIYVKCNPGDGDDFTTRFVEDGTGSTLPENVVHRARFTIAHEIAHTLFYDTGSLPPRLKVRLDDRASTRSLELACNEIAGSLLLPEPLLRRDFSNEEFVLPEALRRLADTAMVSCQTVVRRFQQLRKFSHPEAILASIARQDTDWIITALSRHYSLRGVFAAAKVGSSVKMMVDDPDFVLLGGEMREVGAKYSGHGEKAMTMQFACELGIGTRRSALVTGRPVREI
jgi:hypothetical protein